MNNVTQNLAWEIEKHSVTSNGIIIPNYNAIIRNDNNKILHVAKKTYSPVSNSRFIEVVEKLKEITGYEIAGYSEFKGGKRILGYLKANENSKLMDWDVEDYMVIGNSHDGTTGFFVGTSAVMLRCMNQWSKINQKMKVFHTKNHDVKINEILAYFEGYKAEKERMNKQLLEFSKIKIDEKVIIALAERLLRIDNSEEMSARKETLYSEFRYSIDRETKDLGNNALGLFHGVTHYTTHVRKTNEKVFGNVVGEMAKMNKKAFDFCNELVTV